MNYLWAWVYDRIHPPPFSVYRSAEATHWVEKIHNLSECLRTAGTEYARERRMMWVLFGWPLDGK